MTKCHYLNLISPPDCHAQTPSVSFINYLSYFEADLIISLEILTLTDIDHVSIMKSSVCPTPKRGGITGQSDPNMLAYIGSQTLLDPYIGSIGLKIRRYKEIHARHARQSHLMRVMWTPPFPKEGITTHSKPIGAQYKVPLHSTHTSWKLTSSMRTSYRIRWFLISSLVLRMH